MCTVTFIARRSGYVIGMNRDEKLTRATALAPAQRRIGTREALYPSEPGGGTWMGVNDAWISLALINWYSIPERVNGQVSSRGDVIKAALAADSATDADQILAGLPLDRTNPFRLVGVFPGGRSVVEWRWNRRSLERLDYPWDTNTWISSGFDEPGAQRTRRKAFDQAKQQRSTGSANWLRRLHRSHAPQRGPYSTCMHRNDAATVSYTEVIVSGREATMRYLPGAPCGGFSQTVHRLEIGR